MHMITNMNDIHLLPSSSNNSSYQLVSWIILKCLRVYFLGIRTHSALFSFASRISGNQAHEDIEIEELSLLHLLLLQYDQLCECNHLDHLEDQIVQSNQLLGNLILFRRHLCTKVFLFLPSKIQNMLMFFFITFIYHVYLLQEYQHSLRDHCRILLHYNLT
jgi:hypothetical protein